MDKLLMGSDYPFSTPERTVTNLFAVHTAGRGSALPRVPREAVRQHPELAGTYLNLRAAELAARGLRDPEDQRRLVAQVRRALAPDIEQGEPLQPVRLRGRTLPRRTKDHELLGRQ